MKLVFLGDICFTGRSAPEVGESLRAVLGAADAVSGNLEAPIIQRGLAVAPKAGPTIHQSDQVYELLERLHITHLAIANNHIMDYGESGLRYTCEKLKRYALYGAGLSVKEAYEPTFFRKDGLRVALLAFGEAQFGALMSDSLPRAGFAWVDGPLARQAVRNARLEAEWVIVQVHAGLEMVDIPLPEWRDRFREFVDLGADLVIGHHPHVLQGCEKYKGKWIYYSLGNLYMDVMLQQGERGSGGLVEVVIEHNDLRTRMYPLRCSLAEVDVDCSTETLAAYDALCLRISDNSEYEREVSFVCRRMWADVYFRYYALAIMGLGSTPSVLALARVAKRLLSFFFKRRACISANELLLVHNTRIETHRWVVERALSDRQAIR